MVDKSVSYRAYVRLALYSNSATLRGCVTEVSSVVGPDHVVIHKVVGDDAYPVPRPQFCRVLKPGETPPEGRYPLTTLCWLAENDVALEWDHSECLTPTEVIG